MKKQSPKTIRLLLFNLILPPFVVPLLPAQDGGNLGGTRHFNILPGESVERLLLFALPPKI